MKKILFASTALVATAGMAAADINFSGLGRFGVGYMEDRSTDSDISDTIVVSRFRLNIDGDATTDGGVRFSARVRMQADENAGNGEANAAGLNGARFSAEYEGLRIDVGNAAGAIDNLPNYYGNEQGLEGISGQYTGADYGFLGYSSGGAGSNAIYVRYAAGDFAVAASYDDRADASGGDRWDIHFAYSFGDWTGAIAYGEDDNDDMVIATLGGDIGAFGVTLFVGDETVANAAASDTFYGLSASYDVSSATSINFSYGGGSGDEDGESIGIGFNHDLGGGVSLRGGVANKNSGAVGADDYMRADFGVNFGF
jgi:outer membrane protein OmpU